MTDIGNNDLLIEILRLYLAGQLPPEIKVQEVPIERDGSGEVVVSRSMMHYGVPWYTSGTDYPGDLQVEEVTLGRYLIPGFLELWAAYAPVAETLLIGNSPDESYQIPTWLIRISQSLKAWKAFNIDHVTVGEALRIAEEDLWAR